MKLFAEQPGTSHPSAAPTGLDRRRFLRLAPLAALAAAGSGCADAPLFSVAELDMAWGRRGLAEGRLQKPRALAIDEQDQIYIVDMTARIQVFTRDGQYLRGWRTPQFESGKPCGLTIDAEGNLLVADTHYFRMLAYSTQGELLEDRTIGGRCGHRPGEFFFVTDCLRDSQGNYYISEYGDFDRVQKFSPEGEFLLQWGSHGSGREQFLQPRSLAIDAHDHIWVADACNHRIQVFDATKEPVRTVRIWGREGYGEGELRYPYGVALDGRGHVFICEFGNSRVQKFTVDGEYLGSWGSPGRREGELHSPWDLALDSRGQLHVLDTYNHRVQRLWV